MDGTLPFPLSLSKLWFAVCTAEKAVSDGRETQALLRSQMSTLEAERQKAIEPYVTFTTLFPLPLLPLHLSQAVQTAEEVKETEAATRVQLAELEK
jgi:hypothetical protein